MEGNCTICRKFTTLLDEHHIVAQSVGGKKYPTAYLCPTCHTGIHAQAVNILAKTVAKKDYFTGDDLKRAVPYVNALVRAMMHDRENFNPHAKSLVSFRIPKASLRMLHLLKSDAGASNLNDFLKAIIVDYAARRGVRLNLKVDD